jgi:Recombinase
MRAANFVCQRFLYKASRHLEEEPTEQAALAEIRRLRRAGATLRGIATALNERALQTRRGTAWRLESVVRVLKSDTRAKSAA